MSIAKYIMIRCDKCQVEEGPVFAGARAAKGFARDRGWKIGKARDFCPSCRKDIEAAIKEAAAGNI